MIFRKNSRVGGSIIRKAAFWLLVVTVIWGTTFPLQKLILEGVSPFVFNAIRFWIATLVTFMFFRKQSFRYGVIIGIILAAGYITQTWGLTLTSASKSGFITSLYIILIPPISFLIEKERLTNFQKVGFPLALIGCYFLSGGIQGFTTGDFLTLICAVSFAFHVVVITLFSKKIPEEQLLGWQFATVAVTNTLLGVNQSWKISIPTWAAAIYTALFATILCIFLQMRYQKRIGSNASALIFIGEPVFATVFSILLLKETLTTVQWLGAMILLFALVLASWKGVSKTAKKDFFQIRENK